jgi:hypothetical protein
MDLDETNVKVVLAIQGLSLPSKLRQLYSMLLGLNMTSSASILGEYRTSSKSLPLAYVDLSGELDEQPQCYMHI